MAAVDKAADAIRPLLGASGFTNIMQIGRLELKLATALLRS